jgi:subtilisin family serine protease
MTSRLSRTILPLLAASAVALAAPSVAGATDLIVRYKPGTDASERADARDSADVVHQEQLPVFGMELVEPEPGTSATEAIAALEGSGDVLYAQTDTRRQIARVPTAANYRTFQWDMPKIGAEAAWDLTIGDPTIPVAVVDTGIDMTHPDLQPNIWTNAGEIAGDGIDNDGDGYVDDVHGWDFAGAGLAATDPGDADPTDEHVNGHGTHVAGTIGASGSSAPNSAGAVGVAWQTALMPLRALDAAGSGYTSNLIEAYAYAKRKGARVVNLSVTGSQFDRAEYDAISAASDVLFVVAAGNQGLDNAAEVNPSTTPKPAGTYPCQYDLPNILCVAATDSTDSLATFSNYGAKTVDLAAPGVQIWSTRKGGGGVAMNGTSMATPHVAGGAALVLALHPTLTPWQIGQVLINNVDPVEALRTKTVSGGRLNLAKALGAPVPTTTQPASTPSTPAPTPTPTPTTPPSDTTQPTTPTTDTTPSPPVTPAPSAGAPAQAPAPAPAASVPATVPLAGAIAIADRTTPALRISVPGKVTVRTALAGRLRSRATTNERGTIRLTLSIDARTAKRLRIGRAIGSGSVILAGSGTKSVAVRLTSNARRALARARNIRATLAATATDAAGNRSSVSLPFTLR